MKTFRSPHTQRGSVVLVAMCFLAVLGIALASYLAVSNQAMKLSNRSYLAGVSEQLAEMGLEQTLWAFNRGNWDTSVWTISGTTATRTISFASSKYGNGTIGSINVRVDNYNATATASEWKSTVAYPANVPVYFGGSSKWIVTTAYAIGDVVNLSGVKYRCIQANTGQTPPNVTYWAIAADYTEVRTWWMRSTGGTAGQLPATANGWANITPVIYAEGVITPLAASGAAVKTQLRAVVSIAPLFPNAVAAASTLIFSAAGTIDSYDSASDPTAATPSYSAVLAATGTTNPAITVTSSTVKGYVAAPSTPSYASLTSFGGSASLKNKSGLVVSPHPTAANVDLTRISRSPYVPQFDPAVWDSTKTYHLNDVVRAANGQLYVCKVATTTQATSSSSDWTSRQLLTIGSTIGVSGGPTVNYWYNGDLLLDNPDSVTIQGPAVLDIQGSLRIRNGGVLTIENTGSAEIHFSDRLSVGSTSSAATNGVVNMTKDPKKLLLVGKVATASGTNRYWSDSSSPLYGTIYMPNLNSTLTISSDVFGAVSARSVTFPLANTLHYDTSLRTATFHSIDTPYVITEWRELTDAAERVTLP